jgi:hypothetical protein
MPAVAGLRGTGAADWATDERPKNFREMILWRDPNGMTPLTALMAKMGEESTDDPEFSWYEEEMKPIRVKVAAVATTGQASVTLDTAEDATALDLVAGDLLMVEKLETAVNTYPFEIVEVSADPTASTTLAITRGAAGTSANTATIATNTFLLKIGSAYEEGSSSPEATSRKPTKLTNKTQIFKTTYRLTNTAKETRFRTGDPVKNDKKRRMFDHAVALELASLFGTLHETVGSANKPKRYTGGLYYYLAQHYNATTTPTIKIWTTTAVTEENILDAVYPVFDYGYTGAGNERIGLCGNGFMNYLNKIVLADSATQLNYDGTIKVFGMELQTWRLPQGTIYLRSHPLMNVNTRFTNGCFLINPAGIKYRPLRNRDTKFKDNVQANDDDETKGLWLTEMGVEFHHLRSMMYMAIQV